MEEVFLISMSQNKIISEKFVTDFDEFYQNIQNNEYYILRWQSDNVR